MKSYTYDIIVNGPGDSGSITGQAIPKTSRTVLGISLLNTQHYKVRIKGEWSNPGKVVVPSTIPR